MPQENSIMLRLLEENSWSTHLQLMERLKASAYWNIFISALEGLDRSALYMSHVHGIGHIERTMLHGAFCAMEDGLSLRDAELLMLMCCYHDTGRVSDWLDNAHGLRSSVKLAALTGLEGEELKLIMAGVEAHSLKDSVMDSVIASHAPSDTSKARMLAELLKDADGLDRVRIHDLDPRFLRRAASRERADFAQYLFDRYSELSPDRPDDELDGFELSTISAVKNLVSEYWSKGYSCAQTTIIALGNLLGIIIEPQLLDACSGLGHPRCGMADAGLLMIGVYCSRRGMDRAAAADLCREYIGALERQYGSVSCSALSPAGSGLSSCESLSVDIILFTYKFITGK